MHYIRWALGLRALSPQPCARDCREPLRSPTSLPCLLPRPRPVPPPLTLTPRPALPPRLPAGGHAIGGRTNDLFLLDLGAWQWSQPAFSGTAPSPRQVRGREGGRMCSGWTPACA